MQTTTSDVWATTISATLIIAVLGFILTDMRQTREDNGTRMESLRKDLGDKLEALRGTISAIGERVARLEARVDALESFVHTLGLSDAYRDAREAMHRRTEHPDGQP